MSENPAPEDGYSIEGNPCFFFHFGLIVTGKGEHAHLPKLFSSLMSTGICTFEVIRYAAQRSPVTSAKKTLCMVGSGRIIPDKDEEEIGLPARRYLDDDPCRFVIVIDDLENDRRPQAQQVFERYRLALDTVLNAEQRRRASVHFLVNMLEAYYFADANAVNAVLTLNPPLEDYAGDVETIRHPKAELKRLYANFREIEDGGRILNVLEVGTVLSRPDTCAGLRTLFAWCVRAIETNPDYEDLNLSDRYQLGGGILSDITQVQLDCL